MPNIARPKNTETLYKFQYFKTSNLIIQKNIYFFRSANLKLSIILGLLLLSSKDRNPMKYFATFEQILGGTTNLLNKRTYVTALKQKITHLGFMFVCFFFSFTILFLDALYSSLIFRELHFAHFKTYGNNNSTFS